MRACSNTICQMKYVLVFSSAPLNPCYSQVASNFTMDDSPRSGEQLPPAGSADLLPAVPQAGSTATAPQPSKGSKKGSSTPDAQGFGQLLAPTMSPPQSAAGATELIPMVTEPPPPGAPETGAEAAALPVGAAEGEAAGAAEGGSAPPPDPSSREAFEAALTAFCADKGLTPKVNLMMSSHTWVLRAPPRALSIPCPCCLCLCCSGTSPCTATQCARLIFGGQCLSAVATNRWGGLFGAAGPSPRGRGGISCPPCHTVVMVQSPRH